jgi:glycosyltransferase involved in cell wall biosynthesis
VVADASTPLVSVLLPARDAAATLAGCLESLRRQAERRWECVLVDDGSVDGTAALARRFAAEDPRIRVFAEPHRGLVGALNRGLERCRGRYVARMDADDLMHRRRLAEQVALLQADVGPTALGCHVRLFPRSTLGPGARRYERWLNGITSAEHLRTEAFVECPLAHPTLMIRRDRLTGIGGYRDRGWPEDYDLVLRLLAAGDEIGVLARRRLCWRWGPRSLSRTSPSYRPERFIACKAAFLSGGLLACAERYVLWGHGGTGRALRRELESLGKRASHIVELHPGRIGQRIHGAAVVSPEALAALPRAPLVVSVAGHEPRSRIRRFLAGLGLRETVDFVCAA